MPSWNQEVIHMPPSMLVHSSANWHQNADSKLGSFRQIAREAASQSSVIARNHTGRRSSKLGSFCQTPKRPSFPVTSELGSFCQIAPTPSAPLSHSSQNRTLEASHQPTNSLFHNLIPYGASSA